MSIDLISKHRSKLMAFAIIWLSFYHMYYSFSNKEINFLLCQIGYGGNDLFFFLSSFGLYFAYKKDSNYLNFIKRRLLRILPYSIPAMFIVCLYFGYNLTDTLIKTLGLCIFFSYDILGWFISTIILFYLITPLYLRAFNEKPLLVTIIGIMLSLLIGVAFYGDILRMTAVSRLPVFLLGFYFAYLYDRKIDLGKLFYAGMILLSAIGLVTLRYCFRLGDMLYYNGLYWYPFVLITPGLLIIASYIIDKLVFLHKPLNYVGGHTLEFLLFSEMTLNMMYRYYDYFFIDIFGFDFLFNAFIILINLGIAIIYKKAIGLLLNATIKR